jgi:hypothetical protein
MRDFVGRRDLGTKAVRLDNEKRRGGKRQRAVGTQRWHRWSLYRELLRLVVGGNDVADGHHGLQVLVGLARWVAVVERLGVLRVAVGGREVDGERQTQLAPTGDVFEESVEVRRSLDLGPGQMESSLSAIRTSEPDGRRPGAR